MLASFMLLSPVGTAVSASGGAVAVPAALHREPVSTDRETAIFAGGCFWGVQGVFSHVRGVLSATSGYAGGKAATARYETVSTGTTGHAESVRVVFNPRLVNYADLLRIYFSVVADPTEVNRQGPDRGPQYRTALFPLTPAQASVARDYIAQLSAAHVFARPIATKLETQHGFFAAEAYHQDFMAKNPDFPYIVINDRPKVDALRRLFPHDWKA
ncbi:peptide-methionine (S)-S-oxide reductase MsrA [Sphingomonas sp. CL5.1]|uniref:peptide-methionine (S)-S-oxide reductase MsrA n=1 Tax=Sphingomonas sp. CL5.1 TaxID=2653203 RepID=UPI0020C69B24|nr:peptide-methionine (S)-S-oxide reductase MsrA [Sphingomonas sp. CL5.1]